MLKPEDFEITLEGQLKLRVIEDEIKNCHSIETLQKNLIETTKMLMKYQKMLNSILAEKLRQEIDSVK